MFGFFPFAAGTFAEAGSTSIVVDVDGVQGDVVLGTVSVAIGVDVLVLGVQAVGRVNKILLWSPIIDTQYPDWQNIPDGQTPAWALVNDSQTPGWALVDDTQVSGWTPVDDNPATNWTQIPT